MTPPNPGMNLTLSNQKSCETGRRTDVEHSSSILRKINEMDRKRNPATFINQKHSRSNHGIGSESTMATNSSSNHDENEEIANKIFDKYNVSDDNINEKLVGFNNKMYKCSTVTADQDHGMLN